MYSDRERAFHVQRMWAEGLRPATASRLWGSPSRGSLRAWELDALAGRLDCERPRAPHACPARARHSRYPEETVREAVRLRSLGRPSGEVARALGLPSGSVVGGWWRAHLRGTLAATGGSPARPAGAAGRGAGMGDEGEPGALRARVRELELENAVLWEVARDQKAGDPARLSSRRKAELGERLRRERGWSLSEVLGALRISGSTYEYNRARLGGGRSRDERREAGDRAVAAAFEASGGSYGYRRLAAATGLPQREVRASMRRQGLSARRPRARRRWSSYAGEASPAPPNLLLGPRGHDFSAGAPNERWVTDITEMRAGPGRLYLSVIADLYDGRVVAWSASERPGAELADSTLRAALATLREGQAPLIHSDRGAHYRWPGWVALCEAAGLTRSMSRKGRSPDNAACEAFFGRMKVEMYHGREWAGPGELSEGVASYLEWYNSGRLKSFREPGRRTRTRYETIDGRRARLGLPV